MIYRIIPRRPLVIAIYEPRWFMKVLNILRSRDIEFSVFEDEENMPYYSVLYTDHKYFIDRIRSRNDVYVVYDPRHSCRMLEKSILITRFKDKYNELIVGIDPGRTPYMVVLGDDEVLEHRRIGFEFIVESISDCLKCYPARKTIVRVGGGFNGWRIILRIKDRVNANIEVVDEAETTPRNDRLENRIYIDKYFSRLTGYKKRDAYAALKIALRKGIEVV